MCGFVGKLGKQPKAEQISRALAVLKHRGPDGHGVLSNEAISLLHTRLKIIDLSNKATQPMIDSNTGVAIVYNGEIYNYLSLRGKCGTNEFLSQSDTEVVLQLYLTMGIQCVEQLAGMFSFAIWDPRDHSLHLVRDRFGIKPLFLHYSDKGTVFGSEIKPILALGVPCLPDMKSIEEYLVTGRLAHNTRTFFQNIQSLPAATITTIKNGKLEQTEYWTPSILSVGEAISHDPEEHVWELFKQSLQQHLVSDVDVGISLSAGLDSQLITRTLGLIQNRRFNSFTFGYNDKPYDEIEPVRNKNFGVDLNYYTDKLLPENMIKDLETAIFQYEMPLGGLGSLSAWHLMSVAEQMGTKVLLSGEGSDEIFGGYQYYYYAYFRDLYRSGQIELLSAELDAFERTHGIRVNLDNPQITKHPLDRSTVRAPDGTRLDTYGYVNKQYFYDEQSSIVPCYTETTYGALKSEMLADVSALKLPKLLCFQDRASMSWGVETRVPFLDHRIIEYVYTLPSNWFIRDGVSKFLPKQILKQRFNIEESIDTKRYVATPQREWLKGQLFDSTSTYIKEGVLANSGLLDYAQFGRDYQQYAQSHSLGNSFFVWKVLNMDIFLRNYFPDFSTK